MTITRNNLTATLAGLTPMDETLRADLIDALAHGGHSVAATGPEHCSVGQLLRRVTELDGGSAWRNLDGTVEVSEGLFAGHYATPHRIAELRHYEEHPIDPHDALEADIGRLTAGVPCPHRQPVPHNDGERCDDCCAAYRPSAGASWQTPA